jgi:hypothetical protein
MLMTIDVAIKAIDPTRTISGLIFTPSVSSLKNVRRPALEAGIGALFFLLLIDVEGCQTVLKGTAVSDA